MRDQYRVLVVEEGTPEARACAELLNAEGSPAVVDLVKTGAEAERRLEAARYLGEPPYDAVVAACDLLLSPRGLRAAAASTGRTLVIGVGESEVSPGSQSLAAVVPSVPGYAPHLAMIVGLVMERHWLAARLEDQSQKLLYIAARDELTGLANRRRFAETLETEIERAQRFHRPLTLLLCDLDALKLINDTHGQQAGDAALSHVAQSLGAGTRRYEVAARIGGDEFAALLVDTNYDQGRHVAEKLRERIASEPVRGFGPVTVSIGLASLPAHAESAAELMRMADQALYEAKGLGRDQVAVCRDFRAPRLDDRQPVRFRVVMSGRNSRGELFVEETETETISRRGGRVVTCHAVTTGEPLEIHTPFHGQRLMAQVTGCYQGEDGRFHLGFRLVDPGHWIV